MLSATTVQRIYKGHLRFQSSGAKHRRMPTNLQGLPSKKGDRGTESISICNSTNLQEALLLSKIPRNRLKLYYCSANLQGLQMQNFVQDYKSSIHNLLP
mmetsp:Transcript_14648/g.22359  ORF Transcript_14648/g.22359 Transcript_14648/m.22359 type:complete len:99 (-) Transcript_14648:1141-1437(-)